MDMYIYSGMNPDISLQRIYEDSFILILDVCARGETKATKSNLWNFVMKFKPLHWIDVYLFIMF